MSRHILTIGEKRMPYAAFSTQYLTQALQLPQRKEKSGQLGIEKFVCSFPATPACSAVSTTEVVRKAIMDAVSKEYLRAVLAICFLSGAFTMTTVQPLSNRLAFSETLGVLSAAHEGLSASPLEDTVLFEEDQATHSLAGVEFAQTLLNQFAKTIEPAVLMINVHHDYLQIRHNLLRAPEAILQVMYVMGKKA